jgi:hypothetical protein
MIARRSGPAHGGLRRAALPSGLDTPLSKTSFCQALRLEDTVVLARLWGLLDTNEDGFPSVGEVLASLARVAAGQPLRGKHIPSAMDWKALPSARDIQLAFAFALYDLDDSGSISLDEVEALMFEQGANRAAVKTTIRAVLGGSHRAIDFQAFKAIADRSSNYLFPAWQLQEVLAEKGRLASLAYHTLHAFFEKRT